MEVPHSWLECLSFRILPRLQSVQYRQSCGSLLNSHASQHAGVGPPSDLARQGQELPES